MKNGKAPGPSGIGKAVLVELPNVAIHRYIQIINLAFSLGYFPIIFRNGILIFIPKPEKDSSNPNNYRPITLLEIPGKIMEHIINNRLQKLYEDNNLFNKNQYGFRRKLGTEQALCKLNEIIGINQKYRAGCNIVTRDISKAFDKVWHAGLKYKMAFVPQIPTLYLKLIANYLDRRTVQIKINNII